MKDNDGNNQVSFEISLSRIGCLLIISFSEYSPCMSFCDFRELINMERV